MMMSATGPSHARVTGLCAGLIAFNIMAWGVAWLVFGGNPVLLGTALLAYGFGLRHAVDADHIAAIDNATRKLIESGQSGLATGLYFSLGHASVVVLASLAAALVTVRLHASLEGFQPLANSLATGISALCLFALALANAVVLVSVLRLAAAIRRAEQSAQSELQRILARRGLLGRVLRGVFAVVAKSWHMFPLGFLFGLGFDTATEIGVIEVSAAQAAQGVTPMVVVMFPVLFAAGMALIDTLDAVMMASAYRWAAQEPSRKLTYNLAITAVSIVVAVAIGGVELVGLGADRIGGPDLLRQGAAMLNDNMIAIGTAVIALFGIGWLAAVATTRRRSLRSG